MAEIRFPLSLTGPIITEGSYPLEDVNKIALSLASVIQRRVDAQLAEHEIPHELADFEIRATFPRFGSFEQEIIVFIKDFAANHPVLLAMSVLIPNINQIFSLYDNLSKRLSRKPKVETYTDEALLVTGDKETLKISPSTFRELVSEPEFRDILERLSPKRIQNLEFSHGDSKIKVTGTSDSRETWRAIRKLDREVQKLQALRAPRVEELEAGAEAERYFPQPLEVTGILRAVDLDARTGRVQVSKGAEIAQGSYDFVLSAEANTDALQTHIGGMVKLALRSMRPAARRERAVLVVIQISRLSLASGSAG